MICTVSVEANTDTQSMVTVSLKKSPADPPGLNPLVVLIGSKVYGLSDAPFLSVTRDGMGVRMQLVAPNDLLRPSRYLTVKRMFWGTYFADQTALPLAPDYGVSKLTLLSAIGDETLIAVSGSGVDKIQVVVPDTDVRTKPVDTTTKLLFVKNSRLKDLKQFVFQVNNQQPIIMAVPDDAKPASKTALKPHDPIPLGTNVSFTIKGSGLDAVKRIKYLKTVIPFIVALDKQSLTMTLPAELTASEGIRFLDVLLTDGSSSRYEIDVKAK